MASDQWLIASEFDRLSALAEGLLLYSLEESGRWLVISGQLEHQVRLHLLADHLRLIIYFYENRNCLRNASY